MKKYTKRIKSTIALFMCVIMIFTNIISVNQSGYISNAATLLNLKLVLNNNGSITATWSPVTGAVKYSVLLVDPTPNYCYANEKNIVTTTYTSIGNLPANVNYEMVVVAYDSKGYTITSELGKILLHNDFYKNKIPEIPLNVSATSTSTSVTVNWGVVNGATSYDVLFNGTTYNVTGTSKAFTGLSSGVTYNYSVRAKNTTGVSSYSATKSIATTAVTLTAPTNITTKSTENSVTVTR